MTDVASLPTPGTVLRETYRLERRIGEGGMGEVYAASHTRVPRSFAIKLLRAGVAADPDALERFRREAEVASAIGHDNIIEVFDFDVDAGVPFMVMELLEGEDLRARLARRGRLAVAEAVEIIAEAADGLGAAHARGVVHRDLKPANVFLSRRPGRGELVKVLDFGISKILDADSVGTRTGAVLGTPYYMSPEQAASRHAVVDERTDVFALGAMLYECLTGRRCFGGTSVLSVLFEVCRHRPVPIRELAGDVPPAVEAVVMAALDKDPDRRTPSVLALRAQLYDAMGLPVPEGAPPPVEPAATAAELAAPLGLTLTVDESLTGSRAGGEPQHAHATARRSRGARQLTAGVLTAAALGVGLVLGAMLGGRTEPRPAQAASDLSPTVTIALRVDPPDAAVELDGVRIADRELTLPRGDREHLLVVHAAGFARAEKRFWPMADGEIVLALRPAPPRDALAGSTDGSRAPLRP